MSDPPTQLSLPLSLPYPITITRLLVVPGTSVQRGSHLLEYSFMSRAQREALDKREKEGRKADILRGEVDGNDGSGTWDCLVEGEVVSWEEGVRVGMEVERRQASRPLLNVSQPCSHPVQLHGMCGVCGADLTDLSNGAGPSRHSGGFEITHDAMGVTVSKNEAQRLDNLTRDALLASRRLSLIVDLDQTIIHTTVDPTVAEWMDEIEAERAAASQTSNTEADPSKTDSATAKEKNPNAEALQDVARFQIADDLLPGQMKPKRRPGQKDGMVQMQGRWYFTKPRHVYRINRPGLQKFLDEMSQLYEMHVYTMGTRTYADAICNVIDPDGKVFGGRILSRDESGSFSSKNLKRLFPTDTSMVVVIDDRSDVWADCPNLVKVVPYDFFIGIGDINSAFLPKSNKVPPPPSSTATAASTPSLPHSTIPASPASAESTPPPATPVDEPSVEDELLLKTKMLDEVSESRPLAKMQEALEGDADQTKGIALSDNKKNGNGEAQEEPAKTPTPPDSPPRSRKPLLNPHDYELLRVAEILQEVHRRFYDAYDDLEGWDPKTSLPMSCDVEFIIPELKAKVLEGCDLVFSGLIPQAVDPTTTDIWQTAETFGALCSTSVHPRITHCVTATLNTEKTYFAGKAGAKIVWANWFWDSVALWRRQPEVKYLAGKKESQSVTPAATPTTTPSTKDEDTVEQAEDASNPFIQKNSPGTSDAVRDGGGDDEEAHENMDDDAAVGAGWNDDADKEWAEFMAGDDDDDDFNTENGSVKSVDSTPSTPSKKRVRYADEESLPLEDFKDPSPPHPDDPPAKRRKPFLLEAPQGDDDIPQANKFTYVPPGGQGGKTEADLPIRLVPETAESSGEVVAASGDEGDGASTVGTEGDDEFAMMLMDSLADNLDQGEGEGEAGGDDV
ncbi:hypothetical protein I317_07121 [Kwoniella heveanensis CBS 569]|nr:hypothetical protein I317_07121 [Kwoniella heveanensis CBS 569]